MLPRIKYTGKRNYYTVTKDSPHAGKLNGKIPHQVVVIGEEDDLLIGCVLSKNFKKIDNSFQESTRQLNRFENKNKEITRFNWHLGEDGDAKTVSLEKSYKLSNSQEFDGEKLHINTEASDVPVRFQKKDLLWTPEKKLFSDETYNSMENEIREHFELKEGLNYGLPVIDSKDLKYVPSKLTVRPLGHYKPNKNIDLRADDINNIVGNKPSSFD